jgi:predicted secreted protein
MNEDVRENQVVCDRRDECRIAQGYRTTTCIGWTPVYDGHGNQVNRDPNTTLWSEHCSTCKRTWDIEQSAGAVMRTERAPHDDNATEAISGRQAGYMGDISGPGGDPDVP